MTTVQLNSIPVETLIRHNPATGALQAASVKFLHPGATNESPPVGFADAATSQVIQDVLGATLVEALAENETLRSQVTEISALQAQVTSLQAEKATLQEQLDAVLNPPQPEGDWTEFRAAIAVSPAYKRIAAADPVSNTLLVDAIRNQAFSEVPVYWNEMATAASPTTEEIATLNAIATDAGVPFSLNSQGLMG